MKRIRGLALTVVLVAVVGAGACENKTGPAEPPPPPDPCAGKTDLCVAPMAVCDIDVLQRCAEDADGCLVTTTTDCTANGQICSGGECIDDPSCDVPACAGRADGDAFCDGDTIVTCTADGDGCLVATQNDCALSGQSCVGTADGAQCSGGGCNDPLCASASDGDSFCAGTNVVSCDADGEGCLIASQEQCATSGMVCVDDGNSVMCADAPVCSDHPACPAAGNNCSGYLLSSCNDDDNDGCLELATQDNCAPATCQLGACGVPGGQSGAGCFDPIPVVASGFQLAGADFFADYGDNIFFGGSCQVGAFGAPEVSLSVTLNAGQVLRVEERGQVQTHRNVLSPCDNVSCVAAASEGQPLEYTAPFGMTVTVVVETLLTASATPDYDIRVYLDPACGDGLVQDDEACDDGNQGDGDGCSASCTVELGFGCDDAQPSHCVAT